MYPAIFGWIGSDDPIYTNNNIFVRVLVVICDQKFKNNNVIRMLLLRTWYPQGGTDLEAMYAFVYIIKENIKM